MARNNGSSISPNQASAVPFRRYGKRVEFCLITTSAGRWGFPKGYIDRGESPEQTALKEALEEAGLHGRIVGTPLVCYRTHTNGSSKKVVALLMEVSDCDDKWEEVKLRQRRWVSQAEAQALLEREYLQACLEVAQERIRRAEAS
ncbi:MAG: NUDIX hydrolase [Candidatus Anammoximicrobium sp.]|nr:NUDIX hydrolase [Candidatus Anammoximicrobium sp.]